jgi:multidrug efflux pump
MFFIFTRLPGAFLPNEDQGTLFTLISTPSGATAERTLESVKQVEDYFLSQHEDAIEHMFTVIGFSFVGNAQNAGMGFVRLKDWSERNDNQSVFAIAGQAGGALFGIQDAMAFAFFPPPIQELGNASGFNMQLVDRTGRGHEALMNARNQLLGLAAQNPKLLGVRPNGLDDVAQYNLAIDNLKAEALGVSMAEINQTLQIAWGSSYVNDFVDQNRVKRVYLQADAQYRMKPDDFERWYVRNNKGEMVPFSSFATGSWSYGSPKLERYNGVSSVNIQGSAAPGVSSGEAMIEMEQLVNSLGEDFAAEWTGVSFEERQAGQQAPLLYGISILIVFLCLAALYESWTVPFSVLLVVPLGVLGAVVAAFIFNLANDVYLQVALLTTVGLASKNAILIVEFAKKQVEEGSDIFEAVSVASKQRFRPILMTSMAFILGVTPLALANGAGSAAQTAIGIAVMGGMLAATFLAILFVPMFYVLVERYFTSTYSSKSSG